MKARWDFFFESNGVRFEREHRYRAYISADHATACGLPNEAFDAFVAITPDQTSYTPLAEQTGKLKITLPGNCYETKTLAFWLADKISQQITFSQGHFQVVYGLILGEQLPENSVEADQLGDKPFFGEAHLIEAPPVPEFEGSALVTVNSDPVVHQYNAANHAKSPIDQALGFFKILEDFYGPTAKNVTIAHALKSSSELEAVAMKTVSITETSGDRKLTQADFFKLVDRFVKLRHECAHLRRSKNFGITHGDPRVNKEVKPLVSILRAVTFEAIQTRSVESRSNENQSRS